MLDDINGSRSSVTVLLDKSKNGLVDIHGPQ